MRRKFTGFLQKNIYEDLQIYFGQVLTFPSKTNQELLSNMKGSVYFVCVCVCVRQRENGGWAALNVTKSESWTKLEDVWTLDTTGQLISGESTTSAPN